MKPSTSSIFVQLTALAAAAIPLALSILNATSEPYWLDSPEFTAAVQTLGIPHPPGHPLYVMLSKPFTLLPFGTIAFRVSLASATAGAIASFLLYKCTYLVLSKATQATPEWFNAALALSASLLASVTHAWWFQMVRQEVYALQIMLVLAALYPVLKFSLSDDIPEHKINLLVLASFIFGLGATNHHFIMLVSLPAALPALVAVVKEETKTPLLQYSKMAAAALVGLIPYLFLHLRSLAGVPVAFGGVHSMKDFFWVVSAKVYQKSIHQESSAYLQDNTQEAILSLMGQLGPIVVIASLAGAYLLLRRKSTRLAGVILILLQGITLFMRSLMGIDPFNPDYYGYILPTVAVTALFVAVLFGIAAHVLYRSFRYASSIAPVLAVACIAFPIYQAKDAHHTTDLKEFNSTRLVYDAALADVPDGTVALSSYYKLFFVLYSARYIDGSRPLIHVVNPQLFGYPGYLASVTAEMPELKRLAWSIFVKGEITEKAISDLALKYPIRVEPSPWSEAKAMMHLLPSGILYTAVPEPISRTDVIAVSDTHMQRWRRFYELVGTQWKEHETWRFLSWSHYLDAIYFAQMGDRASAQKSIEYSHSIGSSPWQINQLEDALKEGDGAIDISPFRNELFPTEKPSQQDDLEVFR
ncbi:MAG: DUF2723 domain-containing protein [Deltaproteobacteria bacterium]|nr:DUF2723 domain-containing protein [Deltaproteobacteria bacterium]MBN2674409.1 DUF2723 domain-containing protein [Deltaproteobacteria bacterium]